MSWKNAYDKCPECSGNEEIECSFCNGTGDTANAIDISDVVPCYVCGGLGRIGCPICDGQGVIETVKYVNEDNKRSDNMENRKVYVLMGNKVVIDVYVTLENAFEGAVENSVYITYKKTEIQPSVGYYVFKKEIKS